MAVSKSQKGKKPGSSKGARRSSTKLSKKATRSGGASKSSYKKVRLKQSPVVDGMVVSSRSARRKSSSSFSSAFSNAQTKPGRDQVKTRRPTAPLSKPRDQSSQKKMKKTAKKHGEKEINPAYNLSSVRTVGPLSKIESTTKMFDKKRKYSDEKLGIPQLNGIIPAGARRLPGQKKSKVFVDDGPAMLAIWGIVNAERDGMIESKLVKDRQLEEIREQKRLETDERNARKQAKLDAVKRSLKRTRVRTSKPATGFASVAPESAGGSSGGFSKETGDKTGQDRAQHVRKRVSFVE